MSKQDTGREPTSTAEVVAEGSVAGGNPAVELEMAVISMMAEGEQVRTCPVKGCGASKPANWYACADCREDYGAEAVNKAVKVAIAAWQEQEAAERAAVVAEHIGVPADIEALVAEFVAELEGGAPDFAKVREAKGPEPEGEGWVPCPNWRQAGCQGWRRENLDLCTRCFTAACAGVEICVRCFFLLSAEEKEQSFHECTHCHKVRTWGRAVQTVSRKLRDARRKLKEPDAEVAALLEAAQNALAASEAASIVRADWARQLSLVLRLVEAARSLYGSQAVAEANAASEQPTSVAAALAEAGVGPASEASGSARSESIRPHFEQPSAVPLVEVEMASETVEVEFVSPLAEEAPKELETAELPCEVHCSKRCFGTAHPTRPLIVGAKARDGFANYAKRLTCTKCADELKAAGVEIFYADRCSECGTWIVPAPSGKCDRCFSACKAEVAIDEVGAALQALRVADQTVDTLREPAGRGFLFPRGNRKGAFTAMQQVEGMIKRADEALSAEAPNFREVFGLIRAAQGELVGAGEDLYDLISVRIHRFALGYPDVDFSESLAIRDRAQALTRLRSGYPQAAEAMAEAASRAVVIVERSLIAAGKAQPTRMAAALIAAEERSGRELRHPSSGAAPIKIGANKVTKGGALAAFRQAQAAYLELQDILPRLGGDSVLARQIRTEQMSKIEAAVAAAQKALKAEDFATAKTKAEKARSVAEKAIREIKKVLAPAKKGKSRASEAPSSGPLVASIGEASGDSDDFEPTSAYKGDGKKSRPGSKTRRARERRERGKSRQRAAMEARLAAGV